MVHRRTACAVMLLPLLVACGGPDFPVERPLTSFQELKYKDIVKQRLDFSCGAAALATLANSFLNKHHTESEILAILRSRYPPEAWKEKFKTGFSLEDLSFAASRIGLQSAGASVGISGLRRLNGPVIVHLDRGFIEHFSVFKGISGDRVFLADSIVGNQRIALDKFTEIYTGVAFAVWEEGKELPLNHPLKVAKGFTAIELDQVRDSLYTGGAIDTRKPPL